MIFAPVVSKDSMAFRNPARSNHQDPWHAAVFTDFGHGGSKRATSASAVLRRDWPSAPVDSLEQAA